MSDIPSLFLWALVALIIRYSNGINHPGYILPFVVLHVLLITVAAAIDDTFNVPATLAAIIILALRWTKHNNLYTSHLLLAEVLVTIATTVIAFYIRSYGAGVCALFSLICNVPDTVYFSVNENVPNKYHEKEHTEKEETVHEHVKETLPEDNNTKRRHHKNKT